MSEKREKRKRRSKSKSTPMEVDVFEVPPFEAPEEFKEFMDGVTYRKIDSHTLLLEILPGREFHFSGKCEVEVVRGVVHICGYRMSCEKREKHHVFSPKGYSLLSIQGPLDMDDQPMGAAFFMRGFETDWCRGMRRLGCGNALLGNEMTKLDPGPVPKMKSIRKKLGFGFHSPKRTARLFQALPVWDTVLHNSTHEPLDSLRFAILGGKGVGKSTLTRWIVNKWLQKFKSVIYIDLDPGQGEFTPPGIISVSVVQEPLLGPNFSHLKHPLCAFYLGTINVMTNPMAYMVAVRAIRDFVVTQSLGFPWIINTMGFTQGLGLDFASQIIQLFQPSDVIQIKTENQRRNFVFDLDYKTLSRYTSCFRKVGSIAEPSVLSEYRFYCLDSVCGNESSEAQEDQWGSCASSLRDNVIISYFADLIGRQEALNSFRHLTPYAVPLSTVKIGDLSGGGLGQGDILRSMESNLVALCRSFVSDQVTQEYPLAEVELNLWIGYGVVRAFNEAKSLLHVITPVSDGPLQHALNSVITASCIVLPLQFYVIPDVNPVVETPYLMSTRVSKTKLHKATRKNFVPKVITHGRIKKSTTS